MWAGTVWVLHGVGWHGVGVARCGCCTVWAGTVWACCKPHSAAGWHSCRTQGGDGLSSRGRMLSASPTNDHAVAC